MISRMMFKIYNQAVMKLRNQYRVNYGLDINCRYEY